MGYLAVRPKTSVTNIKQRISKRVAQNGFPVVDYDEKYLGMIYQEDIDQYPEAQTAGEILEKAKAAGKNRNAYVMDNDSLEAAKVLMRQNNLVFLPVVDKTGHYIGTLDVYST